MIYTAPNKQSHYTPKPQANKRAINGRLKGV